MFYFLLFAVAQARVFRGASKSKRVFRFSAAMAHLVSGGIGEEHFQERLLLLPMVSLEDVKKDFPAAGGAGAGHTTLHEMPVATQVDGGEVVQHDDGTLQHLAREKHGLLQSKAIRLHKTWSRKTLLDGGRDSYEMLGDMHDNIDEMHEGLEKQQSVAVLPIFSVARKNEGLHQFLTDLFTAQAMCRISMSGSRSMSRTSAYAASPFFLSRISQKMFP